MAREISEIKSLPLHQIVGAPLLAIVQGQAQAAQSTAEFIERIGFVYKEEKDPSLTDKAVADQYHFGDMRMASFHVQKPDANGVQQTFKVEVPVLALVPIPAIQVKTAEIEFFVKITDTMSTAPENSASSSESNSSDWLGKDRLEFRAAMGRMPSGGGDNQNRLDLQMRVKMTVEQADVTAGMAHLFRLMDQNTTSTQLTPKQEPTGEKSV
ncbi:MAG: DUF2589 domain-containing protein [Nitrospinae bacterium]|nr:DUF2589 domain-containing protein [Nitrospinota bacterium]